MFPELLRRCTGAADKTEVDRLLLAAVVLGLLNALSLAAVVIPQIGVFRKDRDISKLPRIVLHIRPMPVHGQGFGASGDILKAHWHEIPNIDARIDAVA
jgi:hypothetical protein